MLVECLELVVYSVQMWDLGGKLCNEIFKGGLQILEVVLHLLQQAFLLSFQYLQQNLHTIPLISPLIFIFFFL